jgi:hypothetical protein
MTPPPPPESAAAPDPTLPEPAPPDADPDPKLIAAEIRALRRGWGLREDVSGRLGPWLAELAARSRDAGGPGPDAASERARGNGAAELRRRLADELRRLAGPLPAELRTAVLAALALEAETREMRTYEQRRRWFADKVIYRVPRTAERRINKAQDLLAQEVAAELARLRHHAAATEDSAADDTEPAWYIESFSAVFLLDGDAPEAIERRRIVALADGLQQITIALDVPPEPGQPRFPLQMEMIKGGELVQAEEKARATTRYLVQLPRPLGEGEAHEYVMRVRILPGGPMRNYYIFRPKRRCDSFDVRVQFDRRNTPAWVRRVTAEDVYDYYSYDETPGEEERVDIDWTGEARASFTRLRPHYGFGLQWAWTARDAR